MQTGKRRQDMYSIKHHTAERVDSSRNYKHPEYQQQWGRVKLRLGFVIVPPPVPTP